MFIFSIYSYVLLDGLNCGRYCKTGKESKSNSIEMEYFLHLFYWFISSLKMLLLPLIVRMPDCLFHYSVNILERYSRLDERCSSEVLLRVRSWCLRRRRWSPLWLLPLLAPIHLQYSLKVYGHENCFRWILKFLVAHQLGPRRARSFSSIMSNGA